MVVPKLIYNPITAMVFFGNVYFSAGQHYEHLITVMGVVDTSGHCVEAKVAEVPTPTHNLQLGR